MKTLFVFCFFFHLGWLHLQTGEIHPGPSEDHRGGGCWDRLCTGEHKNSTLSTVCLHINKEENKCVSMEFFLNYVFLPRHPIPTGHRDGVYMLPISKSKGRAVLGEAEEEEEKWVGEGGDFLTTCHTQIAHRFCSLLCKFGTRSNFTSEDLILVNKGWKNTPKVS